MMSLFCSLSTAISDLNQQHLVILCSVTTIVSTFSNLQHILFI